MFVELDSLIPGFLSWYGELTDFPEQTGRATASREKSTGGVGVDARVMQPRNPDTWGDNLPSQRMILLAELNACVTLEARKQAPQISTDNLCRIWRKKYETNWFYDVNLPSEENEPTNN